MAQKDVSDVLSDTRRSLEESFFARIEAEKLAKLRNEQARQSQVETLKSASGIDDPKLLETLLALNISAETFTALTLTPLIEVAWADGELDGKEREAILRAAQDHGVKPATTAYSLLESWLAQKPDGALFTAWQNYVRSLCLSARAESLARLKKTVLALASDVAKAAGGFLGFGSKISKSEQATLTRLARALDPDITESTTSPRLTL